MFASLVFPQFDPVAFSLGPLAVRWYGLAYIAAFIFANWYMKRLVTTPRLWNGGAPTLSRDQVDDLFFWTMLGVILGGRLGYVLFYEPARYLAHPLDIVKTWDGGMSFHGGFLGVVVASLLWGRWHGARLDRLLDLGAAAVPAGLGLGRLANFINGELYGRVTDLPWGMVFPGDTMARHPSQLYEMMLEGVALFIAVNVAVWRGRALAHPGRASGIFALGYAAGRIVVESVREPDAFLGYFGGVFTMGMILSLPLLAVGVWLLRRSGRAA